MGESWRPVVGYEGGYEVSDYGRVRSLDRTVRYANGRVCRHQGRVLVPGVERNGYLHVDWRDGCRSCLACARGPSHVSQERRLYGRIVELQPVADRKFQELMANAAPHAAIPV